MSFYGGTYIDYCKYCDDKYSGIFKLKKHLKRDCFKQEELYKKEKKEIKLFISHN